jgi:hypothetical protein
MQEERVDRGDHVGQQQRADGDSEQGQVSLGP